MSPRLVSGEGGGLAARADARVINPATAIGTVRLTVTDLERSRVFYEQNIGLTAREREESTLELRSPDGVVLVELHANPAAAPLDRRATGLYHLALLVPSRLELARSLWRLATHRWPLDGASDHLVSEALYLSDPDANGIEIYRDRPREEWPRSGDQLQMATVPLDLDDLLDELDGLRAGVPAVPETVAAGSRVGHVHLQVADLRDAEEFYSRVLGFEVTVRGYPEALFVSAGGYHHHVGLNTWHSAGANPPPSGSIGLREFEVVLPDGDALDEVVGRVQAAGLQLERADDGAALVRDPSGNAVRLRAH